MKLQEVQNSMNHTYIPPPGSHTQKLSLRACVTSEINQKSILNPKGVEPGGKGCRVNDVREAGSTIRMLEQPLLRLERRENFIHGRAKHTLICVLPTEYSTSNAGEGDCF